MFMLWQKSFQPHSAMIETVSLLISFFSIKWRWHLPSFSYHRFTDFNLRWGCFFCMTDRPEHQRYSGVITICEAETTHTGLFIIIILEQKDFHLNPQKQKRKIKSKKKRMLFLIHLKRLNENFTSAAVFVVHLHVHTTSQCSSFLNGVSLE